MMSRISFNQPLERAFWIIKYLVLIYLCGLRRSQHPCELQTRIAFQQRQVRHCMSFEVFFNFLFGVILSRGLPVPSLFCFAFCFCGLRQLPVSQSPNAHTSTFTAEFQLAWTARCPSSSCSPSQSTITNPPPFCLICKFC